MKYSIGQKVWRATFDVEEKHVECPDCGGTGRIRVIMADDTIHSIGCGNCSSGFNPPTGTIKYYERSPSATFCNVVGVRLSNGTTEYEVSGGEGYTWTADEANLSETKEGALEIAQGLALEHTQYELARIAAKEKDTRSWAWNASYHRRAIKEADKQIAYHISKLSVAAIKAKDKVAP